MQVDGGDSAAEDIVAVIQRELVSLIRGLHASHGQFRPTAGPALERAQFLLLMRIAEWGAARPSSLADALHLDLSTVSRQLAGLQEAGWLARDRDPDDRRASLVHLTMAGRDVLAANKEAARQALRVALADWSPADRTAFASALARLNSVFPTRTGDCPTDHSRKETT